jgi:GH24 family phage-related lysozyme (muramidase)
MADPFDLYDFVKREEGYNPRAYWDHKQWSIGHGTRASGPNEFIDRSEADRRLRSEVDKAGSYVDQAVPGLDPQRRGALASFTYNLGPGWMGSSRLAAAVKSGDWASASRIMQEYNRASGQPNAGLLNRRKREADLFLSGGPSAPQPPDGMDAATYGAPKPPSEPRMALGGPKPMPYDANGKYTPQRNIDHEFGLAEMLMGTRAVGPLDGFVLGLAGGARGKSAKGMTQGNQDYEQGVMRGAFDASSPLLAAEALSRGSPKQREQALSLMLQEKDPARRYDLEMKERALAQARQTDPLALQKMQEEIAAAKSKREASEMFMRGLTQEPDQAQSAQPPAITPNALPGTAPSPVPGVVLQPAVAGDGVMPGGVTKTQGVAPTPQVRPTAQPEQDMVTTPWGRMSREKARIYGGRALLIPGKEEVGKVLLEAAGKGPALGKEARNDVDKKEINTTEYLSRLNSVKESFDPSFQQIETKLGMKWVEWMDSFKSGKKLVSPEQKAAFEKFSVYKARGLNNVNNYIKEITGAAMTDNEAKRIRAALPDPGEGIFDGDSPSALAAKLDDAMRSARMAVARYRYLRNSGFTGDVTEEVSKQYPLEDIPRIMKEKEAALRKAAQERSPGANPDAIRDQVKIELAREFGLSI